MSASQSAQISPVAEDQLLGEGIVGSNRRVYIVDDDSMVRQALFFALRSGGFSPRSFKSGEDFLQEVDTLADGCVLLDLRMPTMDGIGVLEQLGAQNERLPVVMMTAHGEIPSAVAAMKLGALDFVEKPFTDGTLFEVLEVAFSLPPKNPQAEAELRDAIERLKRLTPRETEVLRCIVAGQSNKQVAFSLGLSVRTVEVHRANLMSRLDVSSFAEAVRLAVLGGLQQLPRGEAD